MRLLREYQSAFEAENEAEKLERRGILTFVSSKGSHHLSRHATGSTKVGLWVVLDHQQYDSLSVMKNPAHQVTTALSNEEIATLRNQKVPLIKGMLKILLLAVTFAAISLLIVNT